MGHYAAEMRPSADDYLDSYREQLQVKQYEISLLKEDIIRLTNEINALKLLLSDNKKRRKTARKKLD